MGLSKAFSAALDRGAADESPSSDFPTLLVVDDELQITASLADQFRRSFKVVAASCAEDALMLLENNDVSIIIADQRMPGKTGAELLAEVCRIDADVVRILLTGYADIEAVIQAVNEGKI